MSSGRISEPEENVRYSFQWAEAKKGQLFLQANNPEKRSSPFYSSKGKQGSDRSYPQVPFLFPSLVGIQKKIPPEVMEHIFEYLQEGLVFFRKHVLTELIACLWFRGMEMSRWHAVRNYYESSWAIHPLCVMNGTVYGCHFYRGRPVRYIHPA